MDVWIIIHFPTHTRSFSICIQYTRVVCYPFTIWYWLAVLFVAFKCVTENFKNQFWTHTHTQQIPGFLFATKKENLLFKHFKYFISSAVKRYFWSFHSPFEDPNSMRYNINKITFKFLKSFYLDVNYYD